MTSPLLQATSERVLLGDGAMGTQLQLAGLELGGCGEAWNLDRPERVLAIQRAYAEAGADYLLTNTFGGSRIRLERHGPGPDVRGINAAGARLAREAFGDRRGLVLGDVGPVGGRLEPAGEHPVARVREALREQVAALLEGGVDAILLETQTALDELGVAIEAAREAGAECVMASVAFELHAETGQLRTMTGTTPEQVAAFAVERGVDVLGLNCGRDIDVQRAAELVRRYRECCDLPLLARPNAGQPVLEDGRVVYRRSPEDMAADAAQLLEAGAALVGGCCGTTPAHIALLRERIDRRAQG